VWPVWLVAVLIAGSAGCRYGFDALGAEPDSGVEPPPKPDAAVEIDAGVVPEPPIAYGQGTSGAFELMQGQLQVNEYAAVTGDVPRGSSSVAIDRPLVARDGALVLIWQAGTVEPMVSGVQTSIVLDASAIGQWELARVSGPLDGTKVELARPTRNAYAAGATQIVTVPEFTDVTIGADAKIIARPWDGKVGGIIAFLATGKLALEGYIYATGAGYRGGVAAPEGNEDLHDCVELDQPAPGGESKGEGAAVGRYGLETTGRGNLANGGGGGSCHNNGGGGGGHQGAGGHGGIVSYESPVQPPALGGAAITASTISRLSMGGGGGAGEKHHGGSSDGGAGGGVILLAARFMSGSGAIEADGVCPSTGGNAGSDGAGGGGAGGAIYVHSDEIAGCKHLSAKGAAGGASTEGASGGGGGGGRVMSSALPCPALVDGGGSGAGANSTDPRPGEPGAILTLPAGGF
jgi:hypothetical protein